MASQSAAEAAAAPQLRDRSEIPDRFKWNLTHIFPDWSAWQAAFEELDTKIGAYAALQGTLAKGAERLQVQILFAKAGQASAWFNPELLTIPLPTVQQWMTEHPELAAYRFAIE